MTAIQIKHWTYRDPLLSSVSNQVLQGWHFPNKEELRPFIGQMDELSV